MKHTKYIQPQIRVKRIEIHNILQASKVIGVGGLESSTQLSKSLILDDGSYVLEETDK